MSIRPAAVAGTWYPGTRDALAREVDGYLDAAAEGPRGPITALIAPHAGIMFSGPVAAFAYKAAAQHAYDVVVLVGPSHFIPFEGVALYADGAFDSPFGLAPVDTAIAGRLAGAPGIHAMPAAHAREHSLEMQLPFVRRLLPQASIVPLLMGFQTRDAIEQLAEALIASLRVHGASSWHPRICRTTSMPGPPRRSTLGCRAGWRPSIPKGSSLSRMSIRSTSAADTWDVGSVRQSPS